MTVYDHCLAQHSRDIHSGDFGHCSLGGLYSQPLSGSLSLQSQSKKILVFLQPHLCIQYEVLEAAQLAIESLDDILVEGSCIKVTSRKRKHKVVPFTQPCIFHIHIYSTLYLQCCKT